MDVSWILDGFLMNVNGSELQMPITTVAGIASGCLGCFC